MQPDVAVTSISASNAHPDRVDIVVHAANRAEEKTDAKGIVLQDALGKVETQASGLRDLRLFRNGQMVGLFEGELKDGDFTFPDIQLPTLTNAVTYARRMPSTA